MIAKRHQEELKRYRNNPEAFDRIYPSNPSSSCQYCPFNSICKDAIKPIAENVDKQNTSLVCSSSAR